MSGNRHGRDPFDDDRTEYIGRDAGRGDQPTEYIGRDAGHGGGYDPDADFRGGAEETRAVGGDGAGQYWAPLTPEERGVDPRGAGPGGADPRAAAAGYPPNDGRVPGQEWEARDARDDRQARDDREGRGGGMARGATIIGVVAIIAIVVLVALMFRFLSSNDGDADPTPTTPPPAPSSETTTSQSPTSNPVQDELDRLRDEVNSLRETPPSIPGIGGGEAVAASVPEAVGKSPAEVELALRRAGFSDITILDAAGNRTNSLSSFTGRIATIDPPAGTETTTDQTITITLE